MTANRLVLSGTVCQSLIRKKSPAGVPHCQFVIEHQSQQQEAGLSRRAWCRMPIIVSGSQSAALTHNITVGSKLIIHGFLCAHQGRNGLNKLVLHAEQIELIDTGD